MTTTPLLDRSLSHPLPYVVYLTESRPVEKKSYRGREKAYTSDTSIEFPEPRQVSDSGPTEALADPSIWPFPRSALPRIAHPPLR